VPAVQVDVANAAMRRIAGNSADARTFTALEWALSEDAETGFALMSNLFDLAAADALIAWHNPIMVRADMPADEAIADMGLVPGVDPGAPTPVVVDYDLLEWRETAEVSRP